MKIIQRMIEDPRFPNRRFWSFKHKPGMNSDDYKIYLDHAFENNICMMQYEYEHQDKAAVTTNWNAVANIKEGDLVFLRGGERLYAFGVVQKHGLRCGEGVVQTTISDVVDKKIHGPDNQYQSYDYSGKVIFTDSDVFFEDLGDSWMNEKDSSDSWGQRIRVEKWHCYCRHGLDCKSSENYADSNVYSAIREMTKGAALEYLTRLAEEFYQEEGINPMIVELIEEMKNVVLTGAPGTGKTYLARQIAAQMVCGRVPDADGSLSADETRKTREIDEQIGFVQFHPSYDYTDFVEGLRPIQGADGQIGFKRQDGVFKKLCKAAIAAGKIGGVDNFDEVWERFRSDLDEQYSRDNPLELKTKTNCPFKVFANKHGNLSFITSGADNTQGSLTKENLRKFYVGASDAVAYWEPYFNGVLSYLKDGNNRYGLKQFVAGSKLDPKDQKPFVMIIDEINRGDISKIFGELFYAIDKGYRGVRGRVKTQYQNLIEKDDPFYEGFYVPENVYIIGTMNDIDRNVESMDFAIRRRFTWMEIKPVDRFDAMWADADDKLLKYKDAALQKMCSLNAVIASMDGLGKAYQIGPSYFKELGSYLEDDDPFGRLWEHHLEPLLREYLRGEPDVETEIEKLKAAYGLNKADGEPSQSDVETTASEDGK